MQRGLLKNIAKIFFIAVVVLFVQIKTVEAQPIIEIIEGNKNLIIQSHYLTGTGREAKVYANSFNDVWEASLKFLKGLEDIKLKLPENEARKILKTSTITDKQLGLLIYNVTYQPDSTMFGEKSFTQHHLLIKAVDGGKTSIYYSIVSLAVYDRKPSFDIHTIPKDALQFRLIEKNLTEKNN